MIDQLIAFARALFGQPQRRLTVEEVEMLQPAPPRYIIPGVEDHNNFQSIPRVEQRPEAWDEYLPPWLVGEDNTQVKNRPFTGDDDDSDIDVPTQGGVSVGTYNVRKGTKQRATERDFDQISKRAGIIGLQEVREGGKAAAWRSVARRNGWGHHQGINAGTAIIWDKTRYRAIARRNTPLAASIVNNGRLAKTAAPHILFEERSTRKRFWVMSVHTQVGGGRARDGSQIDRNMQHQYRVIRNVVNRLERNNVPVYVVGDFNNRNPLQDGALPNGYKDATTKKTPIDFVFYKPRYSELVASGTIGGLGKHGPEGPLASDHAFAYGRFRLR